MKKSIDVYAADNRNSAVHKFMERNSQSKWFEDFKNTEEFQAFTKSPVAYFSAEYALENALPTYAGGLGVLAGDFVSEAGAQGFPLIAVGLFYKKGQSILSTKNTIPTNKLKPVVNQNNEEVKVSLPMENRTITIKAWQWQDGEAKVYLLDTNVPENNEEDRKIVEQLYAENRDLRLKQEIILGIGGFRLLARLGYHASVYHLNEGHSAFLALELIRHEMEHQGVGFHQACEYAQKHIVFTNHTLLPAGQEIFSSEKVELYIDLCAKEICLNKNEIARLGALAGNPSLFSMTNFSFKLSSKANAVSVLHQKKSKEIWPEEDIENVTNGIFVPKWDKISGVTRENILAKHLENKKKLLNFVKEKTGEIWGENDLIFGWGRRLVEYKQPLFILSEINKLLEISKSSTVPIRIILSGPTGLEQNPTALKIQNIIKEKLQKIAVFIPNYNMEIAEILTAGSDIWLNTPGVGFEACGTSGMKAALNGTLALSTRDGWVYEVEAEDIGWVVLDSQSPVEMLEIIESNIIPAYSAHLKNPRDSTWEEKMWKARELILNKFSTSRMLREYIEKFYVPILHQKHSHKVP